MDLFSFVLLFFALSIIFVILFYLVRGLILKKEISELMAKSEEMKVLFRSIQLKLNRLQNEMSDYEMNPEENVLEGLQGAGIGKILEALKVNPDMVINLLPAKYKIYAPLIKGFLEGIKKQGGKPGTQEESGITPQV